MNSKPRIGIIGDGNVGSALARGLAKAGYTVETTGKDASRVKSIATASDVVILAVPYGERGNAVRDMDGAQAGKILVDATNALNADYSFAADPKRESGAEGLAKLAPGATVVKAFNTVFAQHMDSGRVHGERLTVLAAADDDGAREQVLRLARDIGFDAVGAGPLANARWLETLGFLNIQLGYNLGMGPIMGFRIVHEGNATGGPSEAAPAGERATAR